MLKIVNYKFQPVTFFARVWFFLLLSSSIYGQNRVWVVSNINIDNSNAINNITNASDYSTEDIVVFLGNAIRNQNRIELNNTVKDLRKKFDRVYIMPGDKDWKKYKSKTIKSIGDYLDDEYIGDVIVPENGCGSIEIKELGDDLALLFIDSEWYFSKWDQDKKLNEGCETYSREGFWQSLNDEMGKLKAKRVVLFARHSIYRYDRLGGYYNIWKNLLPLPVLGTIIQDTRSYFQPQINAYSPIYQEYTSRMKNLVKSHPQMIIVSGNSKLNWVEKYRDNYLININTNKERISHQPKELEYINNRPHILRLTMDDMKVGATMISLADGHSWNMPNAINNNPLGTLQELKLEKYKLEDSIVTRQIRLAEDLEPLNETLFGSLNIDLYKKEVTVPAINLSTIEGGVTPVRLGGGQQTRSLRFEDSLGNVYLARSLKKRAKKSLPPGFNKYPFTRIMDHYFLAAQPLGFMSSSTLDSAARLYHITPKLMYLPRQKRLGIFNDQIGDELVIWRERADNGWKDKPSYGDSPDIISSYDMIEEMAENDGTPDRHMFLRARLLDLVTNDWDRHQDQWRWAKDTISNDKFDTYYPIARDKDQIFSTFDGWLVNLVRPYSPRVLQIRKFDDELDDQEIKWMHWKGALLDKTVLQDIEADEWKQTTHDLKNYITDSVIVQAINKLPNNFEEEKKTAIHNLISRMDDIEQISMDFRKNLLKEGYVRGTHENDSIIIHQIENGVHIKVIGDYDEGERNISFESSYYADTTDRVWIYGFDGEDIFQFNGKNNSGIEILALGGYGKDQYYENQKHNNITIIDDQEKKSITSEISTKYKQTDNKIIHDINRSDFLPSYSFVIPSLSYNTDDGLTVGANYRVNKFGFKSRSTHTIGLQYVTNRRSSVFSYRYKSENDIDNNGTYLNAYWSGPRRQLNYYGGNDSKNENDNRFYNVDIRDTRLEVGKYKEINRIATISTGVYAWGIQVQDEANTFLSTTENINSNIYDFQTNGGVKVGIGWENLNSVFRTTDGARLQLTTDTRYNFTAKRTNLTLKVAYDYYKDVLKNEWLFFSTKVRMAHVVGEHFFYEANQLGGVETLRGFRNGRFTGKSSFAQNTNLNIKLFDKILDNIFPSSFGISTSYDYGRVWNEDIDSEQWHNSYGFGLWLSPLDKVVFSGGYHIGEDNSQIRLLFNWQF